ncbi:hypothetical protein [Pseudomonas sp. FEN]|uniref:hypothetical protein n=1 Tax=Pseudomonas sp. FEN TaxID=2767468 RepID=UPI0019AC0725|nr:hypothetical protein [Pseudomonas sp. FEN]CAD5201970.1 hypothetical protein [Pseudomonas sp. FEN]
MTYVSNLLETAELNGDEISLHTNPVERALFWGMLHSVEVARAVVDALLEGACLPDPLHRRWTANKQKRKNRPKRNAVHPKM